MNLRHLIVGIAAASLFSLAASPLGTLRWTVETASPASYRATVMQGESIGLECALQDGSDTLALPADVSCTLYWQTNGMGSAWWSAAGTATTGGVLSATWKPSMDPGARRVAFFLAASSASASSTLYRAYGQLDIQPAPGATPNVLALPVQTLDFADINVANAPWATLADVSASSAATLAAANTSLVERVQVPVKITSRHGDYTIDMIQTGHVYAATALGNRPEWGDGPGLGISFPWSVGWDTNEYRLVASWYDPDAAGFTILGLGMETDHIAFLRDIPVTSVNGSTGDVTLAASDISGVATADDLAPVAQDASNALSYASGVYNYMLGNTNAWFESTNYIVNVQEATNRVSYTHENWEPADMTPPSMQLYENRDGARRLVWDQRDWTKYYVIGRETQATNALGTVIGSLASELQTNVMRRGWAKYTAVRGLDNPSEDTLWIDTPNITLFAGHQWEKLVEVGGKGYYTLTGNGIEFGSVTNDESFLTIKDFEGNACLTFRKTSSRLVYCECGTDIVNAESTYQDSDGRVVFKLTTDVRPTAEFSTNIVNSSFIDEDDSDCPVNCAWTGSSGAWYCHFLLKSGVISSSCFARFKVLVQGENVVDHTIPIKISGGIVFEQNGTTYKIRPTVSGASVSWELVQ